MNYNLSFYFLAQNMHSSLCINKCIQYGFMDIFRCTCGNACAFIPMNKRGMSTCTNILSFGVVALDLSNNDVTNEPVGVSEAGDLYQQQHEAVCWCKFGLVCRKAFSASSG